MPVSVFNTRREQIFPVLPEQWIARLHVRGKVRHVRMGEELLGQGERSDRLYIVLSGLIDILAPTRHGDRLLRTAGPGEFTGEIATLTGTGSLVCLRAREPARVLVIAGAELLRILQTDEGLSETLLRAFILRRVGLVSLDDGRAVLIGSRWSADTLRLKEFLTRNAQPFESVETEGNGEGPLLRCRNGRELSNPSNHDVALALAMNPPIDTARVYDLVVVGAGPAGLAAAVYATTEGLSTVVLETLAPGGQAGSSSRIENYLGFPNGVSGPALAGRALLQSQKFGALVSVATSAISIDCEHRPYRLCGSDGSKLRAHTIMIATGAQYRQLSIEHLSRYIGAGVYYAATHLEARLCEDEEVVIVGGGNSAGQAAMFLAGTCRHVHMIVRSQELAASMSQYLIRRIEETRRVSVHFGTEITALLGEHRLEGLTWQGPDGQTRERNIRHVFLMTGAEPRTGWLRQCLRLDEKHFVRTGPDVAAHTHAWSLPRQPCLFETSVPGIFAVGDVRSGSVKRVASAVGEGSICVQFVHQVLAEAKAAAGAV